MYVSNGHEPRPFKVAHPNDLYEPHRSLICDRLGDETPLLTLYCPVWEGGNGIWGHQNPRASSAVSLTERHWFISLNKHKQHSAQIFQIDHRNVIAVEIGQALLLGWLRINFWDGKNANQTDLLFNAHIFPDFGQLLSLWRYFNHGGQFTDKPAAIEFKKEKNFTFLKNESILWQRSLPAVFRKRRGKTKVLAHQTDLILTSQGFLIFLVHESAPDKKQLTFAEAFHVWPVWQERFPLRIITQENRLIFKLSNHGKDLIRFNFFEEQFGDHDLKDLKAALHDMEGGENVGFYSKSD